MRVKTVGCFDLDGSLVDYVGKLLADLNSLRSPGEPLLTESNLWTMDKLPHIAARMHLIKGMPGWWRGLPEIANGMRVFKEAQRIGFRNNILSKGPARYPLAWTEKLQWSHDRFGLDIDVHVVTDKSDFYGRFLYDDYPEFLIGWLKHRPRGLGIMPVNESNKSFFHPQVLRWTGENWDEVVAALQACYDREDGEPMAH